MESITASDAKKGFGTLLMKVQKAPQTINKNGRPVAVMVSAEEYEALQAYREQCLRDSIETGLADLENDRVKPGSEVMERLRKRIR